MRVGSFTFEEPNEERVALCLKARTRRARESGSTAIMFGALFVPLFFLLFSLFLDLSSYYREQQRAQLAVDEAVLHAARLLPDVTRARNAAQMYLSRFGELTEAANIRIDSDLVTLELASSTPLTFAQFFLPGVAVPFTAFSTARVDPIDAYIAVDISRNVAPRVPAETDLFLQSGLHSTFFSYDFPAIYPEIPNDSRYLTSQCFNRVFSTLKRTALGLHDYLAGSRLNSVGMGVFPSQFAIRDVRRPGIVQDIVGAGEAEGIFPEYHRTLGDAEWCAAAAQFERVALEEFGFPAGLSGIPSHFNPPGEAGLVVTSDARLNPSYLGQLRASEALWSAVAHTDPPQIDIVLHELKSRITPLVQNGRGGLSNHTDHIAVVFSPDLPWAVVNAEFRKFGDDSRVSDQLREALMGYRALALSNPTRRVQLFYVVLLDEIFRAGVLAQKSELEQLFFEVSQGVLTGGALPNLSLRAMFVESPEEALRKVSSAIALSGRQAVLAK